MAFPTRTRLIIVSGQRSSSIMQNWSCSTRSTIAHDAKRSTTKGMAHEFLTTSEVAYYLRLKERTIYELVRTRQIPCARITGKLLFPKHMIDLWVMRQTELEGVVPGASPPVAAGSHDPL